ncbi:T-cell surface glycoprotein CD3 gamma chain-like [Triplophysa rosa]|uniref:CD3 gamma/delta n=1 Tax=Triplophysa rosa TaxID=992332 RepID=A0A9W7WG93_TRIRA|nr:T-cell surface glycoprotein CD3 gamma chain-like [Triplophysa rosa]KAI7800447.1 CD3 gamma/delta [Triplophysa rosa]
MDRRGLMCLFCLLTTVSTEELSIKKPEEGEESLALECSGGTFEMNGNKTLQLSWHESGDYLCKGDSSESVTITVRVRNSENLIQLDIMTTVAIVLGDIAATALIGWAAYSICAQPKPKNNYQRNKASDRQNLINNSGGDTYQPLSTRSDDYSTLQPTRKNKNRAVSP